MLSEIRKCIGWKNGEACKLRHNCFRYKMQKKLNYKYLRIEVVNEDCEDYGRCELKIYLASSWKNEEIVLKIANDLRQEGLEVDCFADESSGRLVFNLSELPMTRRQLNCKSFLQFDKAQKAFQEDKKWLDWCDCCIMVLPAGKSTHLEAGYAKGQGKKLIIFEPGRFELGEFDVMYGFADLITDNFLEIIAELTEY